MEGTVNGGDHQNGTDKTNGQSQDNSTSETDAGGFGKSSQTDLPQGFARMSVEREAMRYSMNHKQRGHCVIFNHRVFDAHTGLGERNGTDRDRDQAQMLFTNLGFQVAVHNNLKVHEIKEKIQDLAFDIKHTDCDALVIVFMSHGEQDVLWARDGTFKPDFLFENFQADHCPSLAGKPKLFFIQACRGEGLDAGTTLVQTKPRDEIDSGYQAYKIPNTADFLVCWSTIPGHFSWRNTTNGSWFMQSLVHVLSRDGSHDDLLSMMTSVNRHMILNFESNCPSSQHMHGKKQAACVVSTLMRKVYFTPKY